MFSLQQCRAEHAMIMGYQRYSSSRKAWNKEPLAQVHVKSDTWTDRSLLQEQQGPSHNQQQRRRSICLECSRQVRQMRCNTTTPTHNYYYILDEILL